MYVCKWKTTSNVQGRHPQDVTNWQRWLSKAQLEMSLAQLSPSLFHKSYEINPHEVFNLNKINTININNCFEESNK
jgi:hypothetical protein